MKDGMAKHYNPVEFWMRQTNAEDYSLAELQEDLNDAVNGAYEAGYIVRGVEIHTLVTTAGIVWGAQFAVIKPCPVCEAADAAGIDSPHLSEEDTQPGKTPVPEWFNNLFQ